MQDLTLEKIEWFVECFPDNPISRNWVEMLRENWEHSEDPDPFAREARCLFCDGVLEMQTVGEYWAFRKGLYDVGTRVIDEQMHKIGVPNMLRQYAANLSGFLGKAQTREEVTTIEKRVQAIRQLANALEDHFSGLVSPV